MISTWTKQSSTHHQFRLFHVLDLMLQFLDQRLAVMRHLGESEDLKLQQATGT